MFHDLEFIGTRVQGFCGERGISSRTAVPDTKDWLTSRSEGLRGVSSLTRSTSLAL